MLAHQTHTMKITPMNNLYGMALRNTSKGRGPIVGIDNINFCKRLQMLRGWNFCMTGYMLYIALTNEHLRGVLLICYIKIIFRGL